MKFLATDPIGSANRLKSGSHFSSCSSESRFVPRENAGSSTNKNVPSWAPERARGARAVPGCRSGSSEAQFAPTDLKDSFLNKTKHLQLS